MITAKDELLDKLEKAGNPAILCAEIDGFDLKIGYSEEEYDRFLASLSDRIYRGWIDEIIWLEDGRWFEREYRNLYSDWWNLKGVPPRIPDRLK